jgi:hypothetical protein
MPDRSPRLREKPQLPIEAIPIAKIVPSERNLQRSAVSRAKRAIEKKIEEEAPRVVAIGDVFYVCDGNHRIMARKELGFDSVLCRVQEHKPRKNVADWQADDCADAVKAGYLGFNKVSLVSKAEKTQAYKHEDDIF